MMDSSLSSSQMRFTHFKGGEGATSGSHVDSSCLSSQLFSRQMGRWTGGSTVAGLLLSQVSPAPAP